jgi:hypothetical protein
MPAGERLLRSKPINWYGHMASHGDIVAAPKQSSPAQHKPQQTNDDDDDWCACGTSSTPTAATPKASSASASKSGSSSLFQLGHLVAL